MKTDFLIIGQGLAGSLLAWELVKRDQQVIVVDSGGDNASLISAGIVNPVTGMRFVKSANVDTLLPAALKYYKKISEALNQIFFIEKPMLRIFKNSAELTYCQKRLKQPDYSAYLGKLNLVDQDIAGFKSLHGSIEQKQTGHLLTVNLLAAIRQWLTSKDSFRLTSIDYSAINLARTVNWQNIKANRIIFCEGYQGMNNPWFSWLPFKPAKGEILTLKKSEPLPDKIFNYGHWLIPSRRNEIRLGATFDWDIASPKPTEIGKENLLSHLKVFNSQISKSEIIDYQAGVRPCTEDKHPFIGIHPQYPQMAIFNGFGSKGSLQIPWYAQCFADYLLHSNPLPSHCDIQRCQTKHVAC